jgi:inosose dehydratase
VTIRFGVSPIAWINDDMPELGGDTPLESVLHDIEEVGFYGVELGGKFPRDPACLRQLLSNYHLDLVGGWYSSNVLIRDGHAEIEALQSHLDLLEALDSDVFVMAETSNAIHGMRARALTDSPELHDEDWKQFGERLTEVADYLQNRGFRLAYHHHLGTVVETAAELERFLSVTGENVGLTLDTGHAALGGIDPKSVIDAAPDRIVHVHCKDVRRSVFDQVIASGNSFLDGVLQGMFTAPGDGDLEFLPLFEALCRMNYSGWVIVEAEQDPAIANPRAFAQIGLETLRREARLASMEVAA